MTTTKNDMTQAPRTTAVSSSVTQPTDYQPSPALGPNPTTVPGASTATATSSKSAAPAVQLSFKRYEIKYLLTDEQRERLMAVMAEHMVPDEYGPSTICNIYYDTPSHLLVRRSIEGGAYKEKVRARSYGVAKPGDPVFLELKKKAQGVVYKRRATLEPGRAEAMISGCGTPENQIERELDFSIRRYGGLVPSTFLAYDREAFYAADDHDFRMTFDRGLRYRTTELDLCSGDHGEPLLPADQSILEVKTAKAMLLWLVRFLSAEGLRKVSFSKIGRAYQRELCRVPSVRRAPQAANEPAGGFVAVPVGAFAPVPAASRVLAPASKPRPGYVPRHARQLERGIGNVAIA